MAKYSGIKMSAILRRPSRTAVTLCLILALSLLRVGTGHAGAANVYQVLAQRIDGGEVRIEYEFLRQSLSLGSARVQTSANGIGALHLKLKGRGFERATITFSPALSVRVARREIRIVRMTFSASGNVMAIDARDASGVVEVAGDLQKSLAALQIEKSVERLLAGRIFAKNKRGCAGIWQLCNDAKRLVGSVRWSSADGVLAPGRLQFATSSAEACFDVDSAGVAPIVVAEASYEPASGEAVVRAAMNTLVVDRGCLGLDKRKLRLDLVGGASAVAIDAIETAAADSVVVVFSNGDLRFGEGTVQLGQDAEGQVSMTAERGSLGFKAAGARVAVENGRPISFAVGADAELEAVLSDGDIGLWSGSYTPVRRGKLKMPLATALWVSGRVPLVVSDQDAVAFELELGKGGVARPTPDSRVTLLDGRLTAVSASFDSQAGARFYGKFTTASFLAGAGGRVATRGFVIDSFVAATELVLDDADEPLALGRDAAYPSGRFVLGGEANLISSTTDKAISCELGAYKVDFFVSPVEMSLRGALDCKGQYTVDVLGNKLKLDAHLVVQNLAWARGSISGKGSFAVSIPRSSLSLRTDAQPPIKHSVGGVLKDLVVHVKSVAMRVELQQPVAFAADFTVEAGLLDFHPRDQVVSVALKLDSQQDVISVDLMPELHFGIDWLPDCTYKVSAKPGTYKSAVTLRLAVDASVASVSLIEMSPFDPDIGHDESGCEGYKIAAAIIVGQLAGLVFGPAIGAIASVAADVAIDKIEDALIDAGIRRLVEGVSKVLATRKLPPLLVPLPAG